MSNLTIYKASAGSGKTFAITREYIHLLFRDAENYRRTLGVTFTNKATAEMKSRIVSDLDKIARGVKSEYTVGIQKEFQLSEKQIQLKAQKILSKILHDYSHFSILTIDSFFQRVIRTFAREIGYYQGFDVELDQSKILNAAIDQMIMELEKNPDLKEWLVRFAEDKIEDGNPWDINKDIEKLGDEVFKEDFKNISAELFEKFSDKQFIDNFNKKLIVIRNEFENFVKLKSKDAFSIIQKNNLEANDFKGKSKSIVSFFEKLNTTEKFDKFEISTKTKAHFNDIELWKGADKLKHTAIENAFQNGLNQILGEIIELFDSQFSIYLTAFEIQKHIYVLGVFADLLKNIREYTSGRNIFMISDTSQFLQKLIKNTDTPFVYERVGTFIRHFMIDEFQDTSSLQWNNFRPLIANSLSENNENWIVGDVKQSIYRWRNSDWRILSERVYNDLHPFKVVPNDLKYNWRSSRRIVQFNNSFFRNAFENVLNDITQTDDGVPKKGVENFENIFSTAYEEFEQLVPDKNNFERGYVQIEQISRELSFSEETLNRLPKIIEMVTNNGYSLKDIAILVRTRAEGNKVSEFLFKYQKQNANNGYSYNILSNDSLLIKNSEAVKWMIAAFKYIVSPNDSLNKAFLIYEYEMYISKSKNKIFIDNHNLFEKAAVLPAALESVFSNRNLRQYSIFELSNLLISSFDLSSLLGELPFIQSFQDMLQDYVQKEASDLNSFLKWWDENKEKRIISMPDEQDAIRLMTLHTSKGLEFKIVIIPFGDWQIMKTGNDAGYLWCQTDVEPFNTFELLPLQITSKLKNTVYSPDFYREQAMAYIDNLNLLYVAFTRAVDSLFVMIPEPPKVSNSPRIGSYISRSIQNQKFLPENENFPAVSLPKFWNIESNMFCFGEMTSAQIENKTNLQNTFESNSYTIRPISDVVKQVITDIDYFSESVVNRSTHISSGKVMHEIFQQIHTIDDVDDAIEKKITEGVISKSNQNEIKTRITKYLNNEHAKLWFSNEWIVKIETDILLQNGKTIRPDRVLLKGNKAIVIDFKFGITEQESNFYQVQNYKQHLTEMNYETTGFIWYVLNDKVVEV